MRKYQSVSVFKSTSPNEIRRRLQFTLHVSEEDIIRMLKNPEPVLKIEKEKILEIEKQLNDEYCRLYNINSLKNIKEAENE